MWGFIKSRWVLATGVICLACSGPEPDVHVRVVRAGEAATARLTDLELDGGWRLDPVATCVDDGLVDELAVDAVAGAALLNRSMIAVGNGRNHNVILFAEDGTWRTVGRRGTGPGEFENLAWVGRLAADTGMAYDARFRRVSAFTWHDGIVWTGTIPAPPSADDASIAGVAGSLADRRIIVLAYGPPVHSPGRHRIPLIVYLWDRSSGSLERWITAAGREIQLVELTGPGVGLLTPLFQLESLVRVAGRLVVLADTENVGLKLLNPETDEAIQLEIAVPPRPLTPAEVTLALTELEAGGRRMSQAVKDALAASVPSTMPLITDIHAASPDRIVVRTRTSDPRTRNSHTWWVVSSEGHIVARSSEPKGVNVVDIWEGRAVSLQTTALGVRIPCVHEIHEVN